MKGRDVERLVRKHLLPVLPGFVGRRSLAYRRPVGYFLHGLSFDTSSFTSSRIFVQAFVQPLYQPDDSLRYDYGFRLGDNDFWDVEESNPDPTFAAIAAVAKRDALPFLDEVTGLDQFYELVPKWARAEPRQVMQHHTLDDPVILEDLGYTQILRGDRQDAVQLLEEAIASERENGEYADDERIATLLNVLDVLQRDGLEAGQALLENWRVRTISRLRLEA